MVAVANAPEAASSPNADDHDEEDVNAFDCDEDSDDDPRTEPTDEVGDDEDATTAGRGGHPITTTTTTKSQITTVRPMSKVSEEKVSKAAMDTLRTTEDQSPGALHVLEPSQDEILRPSNKSSKSKGDGYVSTDGGGRHSKGGVGGAMGRSSDASELVGRRRRTSDDPLPSLSPKSKITGKIRDRTSRASTSRGSSNNNAETTGRNDIDDNNDVRGDENDDDDDDDKGGDDDTPGAFAIGGILPSTSSQSLVIGSGSGHLNANGNNNNNRYDEESGDAAAAAAGLFSSIIAHTQGGDSTSDAIVAELVPKEKDVLAHIEEQVAERLEKEREKQVIAEATNITTVSSSRKTRLCVRLGLLLGLLFIVIGAIVIGLTLRSSRQGGSFLTRPPTMSPTNSPTMQPTPSPTRYITPEFMELLDFIGPIVMGENYQAIVEEDSNLPQYQALDWLANHDMYEIDDDSNYTIEEQKDILIERYALTVFFFATGGNKTWNIPTNFMDPTKSTCDWGDYDAGRGVFCVYEDEKLEKESVTHVLFSKYLSHFILCDFPWITN